MKKIIVMAITAFVMGTSFLSAAPWSDNLCLYNGSDAAVESVSFELRHRSFGPVPELRWDRTSTVQGPKFIALGDKFCFPPKKVTMDTKVAELGKASFVLEPELLSISWQQKGQQYGAENNAKTSFSQGNRNFYIDKDNTLQAGKGY